MRATHTRLTLSTLSDEEPALRAAVLSALPHEVREGLTRAATAGWIPAAWDAALARAMCLAIGPAHARRIARLAMGRSMTGTLLGGLAGSALRLFGARPAALYGSAGRAWAHLCRDAGEMRLESHGASEALVVLSGQPAELAIPEYLGAIAGGLEAILDACRARGDVEVVPRPDGARFIARWAA